MPTVSYKYTIFGNPIPLLRPRFAKGRFYDSQYELKARIANEVYADLQASKIDYSHVFSDKTIPINIIISFKLKIPSSFSKKKCAKLLYIPHVKRPDIDNLLKFYLDVFNGILYNDDSRIYDVKASKSYDKNPRTIVEVNYKVPEVLNGKT